MIKKNKEYLIDLDKAILDYIEEGYRLLFKESVDYEDFHFVDFYKKAINGSPNFNDWAPIEKFNEHYTKIRKLFFRDYIESVFLNKCVDNSLDPVLLKRMRLVSQWYIDEFEDTFKNDIVGKLYRADIECKVFGLLNIINYREYSRDFYQNAFINLSADKLLSNSVIDINLLGRDCPLLDYYKNRTLV